MFGPQIAALRFAVKSATRRAVWSAVGGVFLLLSIVFFGVAIWIAAESHYGPLNTAIGFGAVLLVIGLGALAFSRRPPRFVPKETAAEMRNPMKNPALSTAALVNAVLIGITAGRAVRRKG